MAEDLSKFKLTSPGLIPIRLWNEFVDLVGSSLITGFVGGAFARTPLGTALWARGGGDETVVSSHPFQCTLIPRTNPDGTPAGNKVAVEYFSTFFKSAVPLETHSITGLNDPNFPFSLDLDGPDNTTDYISPDGIPDDYVILEVKFGADGFTIDELKIDTNGNGSTVDPTYDAWDDSGDALVAWEKNANDEWVQTKARIVLATYKDGKLQQDVTTHLVLKDHIIAGVAALYPVPY